MTSKIRVISMASRALSVAAAATLVASLLATAVDARPGGGGSAGSRGSNTYKAPPSTQTAPGTAAPMQKSTTPQAAPSPAARPATAGAATAATAPKRGFGSLLMGGLLGAGLFGLLSGAGLFGGLSGFAGILGLLLQVGLIGGAIWLAMSFFRNRQQPSIAGAPATGNALRNSLSNPMSGLQSPPMQRIAASAGAAPSAPALQISSDDFNAFEALLGKIQNSYGAGDRNALSGMATPEMMSYFGDELDGNARDGVRNEVSGGKLLQGDLSEAWTEGNTDYATVAMRYSITDAKVDLKSGRVVSGSRTEPQEVTEVWTFRRPRAANAGNWRLSAIQQVQ